MSKTAVQCLVCAVAVSGVSSARAELFRPFDARRDGRDIVQTQRSDIGKTVSIKQAEDAASWFMPLDEVADLDALLENRRVHGMYSSSHRATLISWATYFESTSSCEIPSAGHQMDRDDGLEEEDGYHPGGNVCPGIPPVPSPGSAGLAAIGCALLLFARQRVST